MRRTDSEFEAVKALLATGLSGYAVARATGVPRSTVAYWAQRARRHRPWRPADPDWRPPDGESYSYLLGLYLGDGHIVEAGCSAYLRITLDLLYEGIIERATAALASTFRPAPVRRYTRRHGDEDDRCAILQLSSPDLPVAFPQHGTGRKHLRSIALVDWQRELTRHHPEALLRGLIHSDGARCLNRFATKLPSGRIARYEYPRYFFSNLSDDIRRIFCEHCELLGIRWTQSNHRNISVSHRDSVALLDSFIGPKR